MDSTPISAKVICDSLSPAGARLTTMVWTYPKFIHGEIMTHRALSRNAASSRAIPVARMMDIARTRPALPVFWGKNQAGMQAASELTKDDGVETVRGIWASLMSETLLHVGQLHACDLHKQIANRPLEWFFPISVVVTATDWDNLFAQRCHPMAQPEYKRLADLALEAMNASSPVNVPLGGWHLPFIEPEALKALDEQTEQPSGSRHHDYVYLQLLEKLKKASVARCARVSYLNHEGKEPDLEADLATYQKLVTANPIHASPFEHVATPTTRSYHRSGNFHGWTQLRKTIEGENIIHYEPLKPYGARTCPTCWGRPDKYGHNAIGDCCHGKGYL